MVESGIKQRERSFIMIKPDGVQRGMVGEVISRFERKGFKLVGLNMSQPGQARFEEHYGEHKERPFFAPLVAFASSGPVVSMVWEGHNMIKSGRKMIGATNPDASEPGTIRGDLAINFRKNIIHASDSVESAQKEIELWFGGKEELVSWKHHSEEWVYEV
jgi:nucleoside-diphosphate kinase